VAVGGTAVGGTGVGGIAVAVGGTGVGVGGIGVAVGGTGVAVGGTGVAVGGTEVAVGGTEVAVGGIDVAVGGTGVAVGGTAVAVGVPVARALSALTGMRPASLSRSGAPGELVPVLASRGARGGAGAGSEATPDGPMAVRAPSGASSFRVAAVIELASARTPAAARMRPIFCGFVAGLRAHRPPCERRLGLSPTFPAEKFRPELVELPHSVGVSLDCRQT
jgi:hypothetical protein